MPIDAPFNADILRIAAGAVLIVDDDPAARLLLSQLVAQLGRRAVAVDSGRDVISTLNSEKIDLILLDVIMPGTSGIELLEHVRADGDHQNIPVLIVSGTAAKETVIRCIQIGADDYLVKPLDPVLLRARVVAALERKALRDGERAYLQQLLDLKQKLADRNLELERVNRQLEAAALTDVLTGLPNRRFAMTELNRTWSDASRHSHAIACLLIDVDHFKRINDTLGHDAGDFVLRAVAGRLRSTVRSEEVVCRIGGEEFLVICRSSDRTGSLQCGERLRVAVAGQPVEHRGHVIPVTVSVGVAERTPTVLDPDHLLKLADLAVYQAKQTGRDRVCLSPDQAAASPV